MAKTILITGSTDGIGLLSAELLAAEGHQVLLHGRSAAKLEAAAAKVGGAPTYRADLSRPAEVRALSEDLSSTQDTIDVVINNAGVYKTPQTRTPEGLDVRFAVNTLAPLMLTRALLPRIPKEGRIINLSSAAQAPVDVAALQGTRAVADMEAYAQSKLAITIWSQELAKSLPEGPIVLAVNPGSLLATKMVQEGFGVAGSDMRIGADLLRRMATEAEFAKASGKYFDNDARRFAPPHPAAADPDHTRMVMEAIEAALAQSFV